jgi:hypothetical protein
MSDVFSVMIPVPDGPYPSVNSLGVNGHRAGRKTPQYHELGKSIVEAAHYEMARTGWKQATYPVAGWLIRYTTTRRVLDPSNCGKCELDFLEKAGVVENDTLIRPITKDLQFDPKGPDRIVIILLRLYPRAQDVDKVLPLRSGRAGSAKPPTLARTGRDVELHPSTKAPRGGDPRIDGRPATYGEVLRAAGLTQDQRKAHKP